MEVVMIREQQAEPIAVAFFTFGILLGVALFFGFISFAPVVRNVLVTNNTMSALDDRMPVNELYRQAGRATPADANLL
jgi:hypothetical protein